jgi:hypothetical protein
LRSHPAPSFEADTFAFALFENDLDLNRILKLLDPQVHRHARRRAQLHESTCGAALDPPQVDSLGPRRRPAHHDTQSYAAAVYLTPDAPPPSGTSF